MYYGLIGEKLSHSYSPKIHRAFFEITGIMGDYRLFELKKNELGDFIHRALQEGFKGLNVTIPYKTEVMGLMERISPEAAKIGAVNTIGMKGSLAGFNTDYFGISYTFQKNKLQLFGKKALITGSGGAAKAVAAYLLDAGVSKLYVAGRDKGQVKANIPGPDAIAYDEVTQYGPFDLIVNTTPVGMYPNTGASVLSQAQLKGAGFVFDLIYNPAQTELMKIADSLDIPNVNGLFMLVAQAVKAQEIWNEENYGIEMVDAILKRMT